MAYKGLTFLNLRQALFYLYYCGDAYKAMTDEERLAYAEVCYPYIIPMQQNFFNPIEVSTKDTYIQYFIEKDERITQDQNTYDKNVTFKLATCTVRFIGAQAEVWAKSFHHLTKRDDAGTIFLATCQGQSLECIGDIRPTNVDFFGKNVSIAFDIEFKLQYVESLDLDWQPLGLVQLGRGTIQ